MMFRQQKGLKSFYQGLAAEVLGALFLMLKGFFILKWRYKTPVGEIDLIARRFSVLCFVEVKKRKTFEEGAYALTAFQQKRLIQAAEHYLKLYPFHGITRFDYIIVWSCGRLKHLKNIL